MKHHKASHRRVKSDDNEHVLLNNGQTKLAETVQFSEKQANKHRDL